MKTLDILLKVKNLIKNRENHCKNGYCKDRYGYSVTLGSRAATKFCIFGAFRTVLKKFHGEYIHNIQAIKLCKKYSEDLILTNDSRYGHSKILKTLDGAINEARNLQKNKKHKTENTKSVKRSRNGN